MASKALSAFLSLGFIFIIACSSPDFEKEEPGELFVSLWKADSLLFSVGFNTCDIGMFEKMVSRDLEFFHDQSGITRTYEDFIENTRKGLCALDYQPLRKVDGTSVRVFPMYNNGILYGAIHSGKHSFYAKYPGNEEEILTSTARFTHVWLLEENEWKLSRVLSFDHKPADQ